jgi:hypothetical protein
VAFLNATCSDWPAQHPTLTWLLISLAGAQIHMASGFVRASHEASDEVGPLPGLASHALGAGVHRSAASIDRSASSGLTDPTQLR